MTIRAWWILLVTMLCSLTSVAEGAIFSVDHSDDSPDANPGDGSCLDAAGQCTLRAATQEANALAGPDTIAFALDLPASINLSLGPIVITDSVSIEGASNAAELRINGSGSRVVSIPRSNILVVMRGLTVANGIAAGNEKGGGISATSADLTLENVVVRDNIAGSSGGGVYSGTGVFRFIDSVALNNIAQGNGGGGGLSIFGNGSVVIRSRIVDNEAARGGGGVEVSGGLTTITDTTVSGNMTNGGGGGLLTVFGSADVKRSTLSNNIARDSGGGIALPYGTVDVVNSTISGNKATLGGGGGINPGNNGSIGYLTVRNSTIVRNQAVYAGGISGGYAPGVIIGNAIVAENIAPQGADIFSAFTSLGGNLVGSHEGGAGFISTDLPDGTDPLIGPLAINGGPTQTHALLPGSPAIDAGLNDNAADLTTDQRGEEFPRLNGETVDIGAFESGAACIFCASFDTEYP
jgi:hypothetical protein